MFDRRSSASIPTRFTTRAAPAATTSVLIAINSTLMNTVESAAFFTSAAFAWRTVSGTGEPRLGRERRMTGAARFAASRLSLMPPTADTRMTLMPSTPAICWAVPSGANTAAPSV